MESIKHLKHQFYQDVEGANAILLADGVSEENIASFNDNIQRRIYIIGQLFKWKHIGKSAADEGRTFADEMRLKYGEGSVDALD